jgi:nitrate reductase delta subunit
MALDRLSLAAESGRAACARDALVALGPLLRYPSFGYVGSSFSDHLATARAALAEAPAALRAPFERFADGVSRLSPTALQELYTRTFDLNPVCALEVGWHLHGESYDRGRFLVQMRGLLERLEINEGGELPDHLASVLPALARLDPSAREELGHRSVIPALARMLAAFDGRENPYADALRTADGALRLLVGEPEEEPAIPSRTAPHHRRRSS